MEGIVIKTIDYKEKSKIVYLYTSFGMKSIKALDVLRTKLGFVTTLNVVDFEMSKGNLPTVTEYTLKDNFYSLYEDLTKVGVLAPILDILQHLEEEVNHTRIYSFVIQILKALRETKEPYYILSLFLVKMLAVFGVRPVLKQCIHCKGTRIVNFSILEGGALCANCATYNERNFGIFTALERLYYSKTYEVQVLPVDYKSLLEAIYSYYAIHVHLNLKNYHF